MSYIHSFIYLHKQKVIYLFVYKILLMMLCHPWTSDIICNVCKKKKNPNIYVNMSISETFIFNLLYELHFHFGMFSAFSRIFIFVLKFSSSLFQWVVVLFFQKLDQWWIDWLGKYINFSRFTYLLFLFSALNLNCNIQKP